MISTYSLDLVVRYLYQFILKILINTYIYFRSKIQLTKLTNLLISFKYIKFIIIFQ